MGTWEPNSSFFENLVSKESDHSLDFSKPYPFYLASPLENGIEPSAIEWELGNPEEWILEWKWDGIRAQLVKRNQQPFLWSRGEALITDHFPEISDLGAFFPDGTVLDGEILAYEKGEPKPFGDLQKRIGKLKVTPQLLSDVPIAFVVYDILEWEGKDLREHPLSERRELLARVIEGKSPRLILSAEVHAGSWQDFARLREESRDRKVEGLMLKRKNSTYQTGRKRGDWWKWKIDPYTIDAVLIYAQAGHGRRSSLFTDYTFALWQGDKLVPVAKAYSGLTDAEIGELDRWIRAHTLEKFGPVRSVEPFYVFEIAFEGISKSSRHKSGVAVRFPRILRWRKDKPFKEANRLEDLVKMISMESAA
jgi:DNA ligase-1